MFESWELNVLGCHHLAKGLGSCELGLDPFIIEELDTAMVFFVQLATH